MAVFWERVSAVPGHLPRRERGLWGPVPLTLASLCRTCPRTLVQRCSEAALG